MSQAPSLQHSYEQLLANACIEADAQQQVVIEALQQRLQRLRHAQSGDRRWWQFWRAQAAPDQPPMTGLYIWGGVGRGKTWLMDRFYDCLPAGQGKRMHYHHFMNQINHRLRELGEGRDPLPQVADDLLGCARVLCLDEFFVSDIGNAMLMSGLLQRLFQRQVLLVTTSNVAPQNLYAGGLQRARFLPTIDLLQQHCQIMHLGGDKDYRLRQLQQMPLYLFPDDAQALQQLQHRFIDMAAGVVRENMQLQINGRKLAARFCAPSQVWLHFDVLCRQPRSSSDFLELAAEFSSVFIQALPVMADDDNDAVRRFIDLVDAFYDQKVKLIIAAAAAIDEIYIGQRLAFEFRRTRSRLREMQSADYLTAAHRPQ